MTIDHALGPWGYGTGATVGLAQPARRIGRNYPPERVGGGATIRPYVIPWTPTADLWSVAFPAGIVGVATSIVETGVGSYSDRMIAGWGQSSSGVIAVPSVLPVGYTARLNREWHTASQSLARVRTAGGFSTITWLPSSSPHGTTTSSSSVSTGPRIFVPPFGLAITRGTYYMTVAPSIGCRKFQYRFGQNLIPTGINSVASDIKISHNADGSSSINTSPPYTGSTDATITDHTHTCGATDATNLESGIYWTTWIDAGALTPVEGVPTSFTLTVGFTFDPLGTATCQFTNMETRISSRVDIPYPFTATGQGDLIAPGGLL